MTKYKRRSDNPEIQQEGNRKGTHASWIHQKVNNPSSVTGYFILPSCICSNCGYYVPSERDRCPKCKAIMDGDTNKK